MSRFILLGAVSTTSLAAGCGEQTAPPAARQSSPAPSSSNAPAPVAAPSLPADDPVSASLRTAGITTPPLKVLITSRLGRIAGFEVTARDALPQWKRLRTATEKTGLYPIILDLTDEWVEDVYSGLDSRTTVEDFLIAAANIECPAWFDKQRELDEEFYSEVDVGEWPENATAEVMSIPFDLDDKKPRRLAVALLPTRRCWEACAHIPNGGWNACPAPETHVAVQKYWHERWGAEIAFMSRDVMQFIVARHPRTRDDALALAWEQYIYCGDIVEQGVETVSNLAASLMTDNPWFFWWD